MEILETPLPQNQLKTHDVSDDAPGAPLINSTPAVSSPSCLHDNDVFDLLWLAFDNKQAVQGVFNVQGAVASGKAELVVFAWQNLMMKDHLRDAIEHRTWQFCKEHHIPTFFVSSMYFLGHGCGFDYAIRAVAVTFQEGSELTDEINDMKRRIQMLRRIPDESEAEEFINSDTLEGKPDGFEAEDHICTGTFGNKPDDFKPEEDVCVENLNGKPDDADTQDSACSEILSHKPDGLETEISASADVLESKPSDLEAIQPMRADSFGSLSMASEIAQSTRTDSFESTSSASSMSGESDDFDPLESSRADSFGSQPSMSEGSVAEDPTFAESMEDGR
ncbi:hypothetical protein CaCOL14_004556 [Colletotrichum acutatum]